MVGFLICNVFFIGKFRIMEALLFDFWQQRRHETRLRYNYAETGMRAGVAIHPAKRGHHISRCPYGTSKMRFSFHPPSPPELKGAIPA